MVRKLSGRFLYGQPLNFLQNEDIANVIQQAANFTCLGRHLEGIKGEASFLQSANDLIHLKNALYNNNNTLFVHQYHEQEIPEVIPIQGIPLSNQLNTNYIKLNVGF